MLPNSSLCAAGMVLLIAGTANAGDVTLRVVGQNGYPAQNAVIKLINEDGSTPSAPFQHLESSRVVDQRDETFTPLVTLIPRHGQVSFANTDLPLHQVYSFSPIKQFELTLEPGKTSPGIKFDEVGIAAIGCNIHDHMIAYIFVTDSPWTIITGENGSAHFSDVPTGSYNAEIWHPRIPPATETPSSQLVVSDAETYLETRITLLPKRSDHGSHRGRY